MSLPDRAVVFGLGLMGGSLARDLAARGTTVIGYDLDRESLDRARDASALHGSLADDWSDLSRAELVVLATPVDVAVQLLHRVAPLLSPNAVVTDVGSTKRAILEHAGRMGIIDRFVGSHPLAGDHRSGWAAARAGLYRDCRVFLCADPATSADSLRRIERLWAAVGAKPELVDPDVHDRYMAWVSHLPQVVASSLATALATSSFASATLGPGGRDMTRLAGSSPDMWAAICLQNRDHLETALDAMDQSIARFRQALDSGDPAVLHAFFRDGAEWVR